MACPSCGSEEHRPIAVNYVECTAAVSPTHRCGVRHHRVVPGVDVSQWPTCDCGTFAVGLCRMCGRPVCGDDSARHHGSRMCRPCLEEARVLAEQQELERQQVESRRRAEQARARGFVLSDEQLRAEEEAIRRHGPCRAFPKHGAEHVDGAGNCRACVVGLRR